MILIMNYLQRETIYGNYCKTNSYSGIFVPRYLVMSCILSIKNNVLLAVKVSFLRKPPSMSYSKFYFKRLH